jgi:hypothetical protein
MTYRVVIHYPLPPQLQIHLEDRIILIPPNGVLPVVPLLEPVFLKLHPRDGDAAFEAFAAEHVLPLGGHLLVGHDLGLPVDVPGQASLGRVGEALEDRIRRGFLRCLRLVCRNEGWAMAGLGGGVAVVAVRRQLEQRQGRGRYRYRFISKRTSRSAALVRSDDLLERNKERKIMQASRQACRMFSRS